MRRRRAYVLAALGVVVVSWGIAWAVAEGRDRADLERANREIAEGRFGAARRRLARLSARRPGRDEVEFPLGYCEAAAGNLDAALAAWARVPAGSPLAPRAALFQAQVYIDARGQLAAAEPLLEAAARDRGPVADEARRRLAQLYQGQSRTDDLRRLLRAGWDRAVDRAAVLHDLWLLDAATPSVESIRADLERAARQASDDDRVWLGRGNLATVTGHFDVAAEWLDACLRRRPEDAAVWRARLDWARAAGQFDEAARALEHLPPDRVAPEEALALRAWFAAGRGDAETERASLKQLIAADPGDAAALEQLASLAIAEGRVDRAADLRRRKATVDRALARYRALLAHSDPLPDPEELARLAESLGRRFEARGWWTLVGERTPEARAALERLGAPTTPAADQTVGDLLREFAAAPARARLDRSSPGTTTCFRDDAETVGLRFTYDNGPSPARQLPETMSGGVALLDYDGDGWLDVYCVQGGPFPPAPEESGRPAPDPTKPGKTVGASDGNHGKTARATGGDRLFHNRGNGTFEDATESAGIATFARGYGHGVAVGDYDNDGHPDLFITRWRGYALFRSRGDGTFEDVTQRAGLGGDRDWPTSAAFADLDGDGDLDLYVCHYLVWDAEHPTPCRDSTRATRLTYCSPRDFGARPDHLFRNDTGRFVDVTAQAGIVDQEGRGLGVVAADFDGDRRVDLYVANDTTANYLFRNRSDWRFEEVGLPAGAACSAGGGFQAGMGIACGDLDGDGLPDLAVTNFYGESTTFYRNLGAGLFTDRSAAVGLVAPSRFLLGFGIAFLDVDDDGRLDLATANGHVNDYRPGTPYAMPAQLLKGGAAGSLADITATAGAPWQVPRVGRGLAAGDLDNDGRLDLLIVAQGAPLAYLHNRTGGGHSVTLQLEGVASNRDAVGARVVIDSGGRRRFAWRTGGGSYLSACDPRMHFGVGTAARVDAVEVTWPSGRVDRYRDLPVDAGYRLREGDTQPSALPGFRRRP
jgi:thioredoxin-like negative regulator of GroEL